METAIVQPAPAVLSDENKYKVILITEIQSLRTTLRLGDINVELFNTAYDSHVGELEQTIQDLRLQKSCRALIMD